MEGSGQVEEQCDEQFTDQVVMVIGGAGFLGQHIIKLLQERADGIKEIQVFDLKPYENKLGHATKTPLKSIVGDLRILDDVQRAVEGVHCVIHTAGLISFGTFPDYQGMEDINVKGTSNVIQGCIQHGVHNLIYTSTVDVAIGYREIENGDETLPVPRRFLFPGYPNTKHHAEQLVLAANGHPLHKGEGRRLRTLVLRSNVMYGEEDPYYVTNALRSAKDTGGVLIKVGDGHAKFQQAYVGNVAWAHVQAQKAMAHSTNSSALVGKTYFITDDTPVMNTFQFLEPFLISREFKLSAYSLPYPFVYCALFATEWMIWFMQPIKKINLTTPLCSLIYVNNTYYFSRGRAERLLGYSPIYTYQESLQRSVSYYAQMPL